MKLIGAQLKKKKKRGENRRGRPAGMGGRRREGHWGNVTVSQPSTAYD